MIEKLFEATSKLLNKVEPIQGEVYIAPTSIDEIEENLLTNNEFAEEDYYVLSPLNHSVSPDEQRLYPRRLERAHFAEYLESCSLLGTTTLNIQESGKSNIEAVVINCVQSQNSILYDVDLKARLASMEAGILFLDNGIIAVYHGEEDPEFRVITFFPEGKDDYGLYQYPKDFDEIFKLLSPWIVPKILSELIMVGKIVYNQTNHQQ